MEPALQLHAFQSTSRTFSHGYAQMSMVLMGKFLPQSWDVGLGQVHCYSQRAVCVRLATLANLAPRIAQGRQN